MKRIDYKIEKEKIIVYEKKSNKVLFELPDVRRNKIRVENLKEDIDKYKSLVHQRLFTKHFYDFDDYLDKLVSVAGIRMLIAMAIFFFVEVYYRLGDPTQFTSTLLKISSIVLAEGAIEPVIREHLIPQKIEREYKKDIKKSYDNLIKRSKENLEESIEQEKVQEQGENKEKVKDLEPEKKYNITPQAYSEDYTFDNQNITNTKKR